MDAIFRFVKTHEHVRLTLCTKWYMPRQHFKLAMKFPIDIVALTNYTFSTHEMMINGNRKKRKRLTTNIIHPCGSFPVINLSIRLSVAINVDIMWDFFYKFYRQMVWIGNLSYTSLSIFLLYSKKTPSVLLQFMAKVKYSTNQSIKRVYMLYDFLLPAIAWTIYLHGMYGKCR